MIKQITIIILRLLRKARISIFDLYYKLVTLVHEYLTICKKEFLIIIFLILYIK